jgi:hypothetical protein
MKVELTKIVIIDDPDTILLSKVNRNDPIFLARNGELAGMIVQEDHRWIARIGGASGVSGAWTTLGECIRSASGFGYLIYAGKKQ